MLSFSSTIDFVKYLEVKKREGEKKKTYKAILYFETHYLFHIRVTSNTVSHLEHYGSVLTARNGFLLVLPLVETVSSLQRVFSLITK